MLNAAERSLLRRESDFTSPSACSKAFALSSSRPRACKLTPEIVPGLGIIRGKVHLALKNFRDSSCRP